MFPSRAKLAKLFCYFACQNDYRLFACLQIMEYSLFIRNPDSRLGSPGNLLNFRMLQYAF
jgi:hypothetical protein